MLTCFEISFLLRLFCSFLFIDFLLTNPYKAGTILPEQLLDKYILKMHCSNAECN